MRHLGLALTLAIAAASASAQNIASPTNTRLKLPSSKTPPNLPLNQRERAIQLLNRFTFGARPGDVDSVLALGADKWFAAQLDPASIPDPILDKRLPDFPTLTLTPEQALIRFPDRNLITQIADNKRPMPPETTSDPLLLSVYQVQLYKLQQERDNKLNAKPEPTDAEKAAQKQLDQAAAAHIAGQLFALPKKDRMAALDAMPPADRIVFANNVGGDQRNTLFADFTPRERETLYAFQGGVGAQYRIVDELAQARELREILSERQLQEVMTDFWFNHFNVFAPKDSDQWYTTSYERDVIRPNALGKFRDLLIATAESPAMMVYLDNWLSIGPNSIANGVNPLNPNSKPGKKGLNENYGREVMELHTLSVNGGYTQADVTHLSAILTGWSVNQPNLAGPFYFDPKKHEPGTRQWFGYTIDEQGKILKAPAGSAAQLSPQLTQAIVQANTPDGMKQGYTALSLLAASPKTAHFISFLIAQRFLADDPPPALVDRMANTYMSTFGDVKAILQTLVTSPEFNSHRYFRNKVKTPAEFVASAFRATATDPQNPGAIVGLLTNQLGMPPYKKLEPTGYYITADHWMNTQSLLARLNFADQLTHNHFANQKFDASRVLALSLMADRTPQQTASLLEPHPIRVAVSNPAPASSNDPNAGPDMALQVLEFTLIGGDLSQKTASFIHSQLTQQPTNNPTDTLNLLTALLLGSPEFQLR
jgi:uncharacterized protein (DUF1800 family)